MKNLQKISFALSMIFLGFAVTVTLMCSFFDYYVIVGNFGTSRLLAILSTFSILFFIVYILTKRASKNLSVIISTVFLALAEAVLLLIAFLPNYQCSTHVSTDNIHTVVVEEKSTANETSIQFYKKVFGAVYEPIYRVKFTDSKKEKYVFGEYTLTFDEKYTSINVPLFSSTEFLLPHSK